MKKHQKSKVQYIEELEAMRRQVTLLEAKVAQMEDDEDSSQKHFVRSPRQELCAEIEFIGDFDIVQAKGINLSDGGVSFESDGDLPFEMRFELEGETHSYRAHLIWVKRLPQEGYQFGLKFVPPKTYPEF